MDDLKRCKQCNKILQSTFEHEEGKCEDCLLKKPCANCKEMTEEKIMVQSFYVQGWLCPECAEAIEKEAKHGLPCAS